MRGFIIKRLHVTFSSWPIHAFLFFGVCVCQPLCQRVHCQLLPFSQQGAIPLPSGGWPTKRPLGGGCKRTCRTVVQAVTPLFLCLFPWWFMLLPLNPFPSVSAAVRRSSAAVASLQMRTNYLLKHLQLIGLLTLPLSHSFPRGIELTEYKCRSVFRSAVPLGC